VVVLGLTFWLIRSFMIPLIWAAVFAIANWPLYRRGAQHVPEAMRAHMLPMVGTRLADAWNDAAGTPGGLSALLVATHGSLTARAKTSALG